ncbi:MAG: HD-GYP domain-containing protein [Aristaeellaceae bacterium]
MQYHTQDFSELLKGENTCARVLNDNPRMETLFYHLKVGACLNMTFAGPEDFLTDPSVMYIVLDGTIEVCELDDRQLVPSGQSIVIHPKHNFSVWAREDTNLIGVASDGGSLDMEHTELTSALALAEKNDAYVIGHDYRVSRYSLLMMQLIDPQRMNNALRLASGFHDVGKAQLDPDILNKPGRLTDEEFAHVQQHPVYSWELLRKHLPEEVANMARWHHEKLDGTGYPDGLRGNDIPLESRVIAVADIFDALTTSRCYRTAFSFEKALRILQQDADRGKIDVQALDALRQLIERGTIRDGVDNLLHNQP